MPLVNAYLFCVVQSLFIIIVITDFSRRENTGGSLESINVRPMYSGRNMTKFRTVVIRPNQRVLFSQGVKFRGKDSVVFEPSSYLSGW